MKLQKYAHMKEKLVRMWQLKTARIIQLVLSITGNSANKLDAV